MLSWDHVRDVTKIKFVRDGVVKMIDSLDRVSFVQVKVPIDDEDVHVDDFWTGGEIWQDAVAALEVPSTVG